MTTAVTPSTRLSHFEKVAAHSTLTRFVMLTLTVACKPIYTFTEAKIWEIRLQQATPEQRDSESFMLPYVLKYPHLIKFASPGILGLPTFMGPLIETHPHLIAHASVALRQGPLMNYAANKKASLIEHADLALRNSIDWMRPYLKQDPSLIRHCPALCDNAELMKILMRKTPTLMQYTTEALRSNSEFMLFALSLDHTFIRYAAALLKNTELFMTSAMIIHPELYHSATEELKRADSFQAHRIRVSEFSYILSKDLSKQENYMLVAQAPEEFRNTPEYMLRAIQQSPAHYQYASNGLKNHAKFILDAVKQTPAVVSYLPENCRNIEKLMQIALEQDPSLAEHIGPKLRDSLKFMRPYIEKDPSLLKGSFKTLFQLLAENPQALPFIISSSSGDVLRECLKGLGYGSEHLLMKSSDAMCLWLAFFLDLVKKQPTAVQYLPSFLQQDVAFMTGVTFDTPAAIAHLPREMLQNDDMMTTLAHLHPEEVLQQRSSQKLPSNLKNDSAFIHVGIQRQGIDFLQHVDSAFRNTPESMFQILLDNIAALKYAGPAVLSDVHTMTELVKKYPKEIAALPLADTLKNSPLFMQALVTREPSTFVQIGPKLRAQILKELAGNPAKAIWINDCLKENRELFSQISSEFLQGIALDDYHILHYLPLSFKDNATLMLPIATKHRQALKYIGKALQDNATFFESLYPIHGSHSDQYASDLLKATFSTIRRLTLSTYLSNAERRTQES